MRVRATWRDVGCAPARACREAGSGRGRRNSPATSFETSGQRARRARMIVVADTSPINYLVLIKEIEILPKL